ncbi:hypothetical protein FSW04_10775 [Baekduia soli]|uniref:Cyclic nucleotide-binding domain-containing protein n=1 Tax=Baekduia soli TaxID=496014 RepID=A0A5B8U539_9ACTN|nr:hypothetical protein [Baekduia soli]QEC48005.1 hypothetical protein FSW04_10775 [Baekduia soli]
MSVDAVTLADLRRIDLFDGLDDAELADWVAVATVREIAVGDEVAEQGVTPAGVQLLLEGTVQTFVVNQGRLEPIGHQEAPTWMGAIAVLTEGRSARRCGR